MTKPAQNTKPTFGFGELDDFQPRGARTDSGESERSPTKRPTATSKPRAVTDFSKASAQAPSRSRAADDAAARLGFASREPLVRRRKRQPIEEPVEQINLRAAVADINTFIEWCEKKRYSYREGFAELVKHIDAEAA